MLACAVFAIALCTSNLAGNLPFVAKPLQRVVTASSIRMFANPTRHIIKLPPHVFSVALETAPPHEEGGIANARLNADLLKAIGRADETEVRALLAEGADVDALDAEGRTPLLIMAGRQRWETAQHLKITSLLLEYGAEVNATDQHGHTPLMLAAKWGRIGTVKILKQHGAEINAVCDYGHTPLILAAGNGHAKVVKFLLQHEANVNAISHHGYTAFMYAMWRKHLRVATLLHQHGADINAINSKGKNALLLLLSRLGEREIAKLIFLHHKIENVKPYSILHDQLTLIKQASNLESKKESVEFLLDLGVDIDAVDKFGNTLLIWALHQKHLDIVILLLEHGAKVNITDKYGRTLLWWAARRGYLNLVKLLLAKGANVNVADNSGDTPLEHGANVNAANNLERTPLMWALRNCPLSIIELLLKNGADVNASDLRGRSVLDWAKGKPAAIELLQKHGVCSSVD